MTKQKKATKPAKGQQTATVAPVKRASKKQASPKKEAPKATAKGDTKANTKASQVLAMIQAPKGATLDAIMKAVGWQRHTVRGFVSIVAKKYGLNIVSTRTEDGARVYSIEK